MEQSKPDQNFDARCQLCDIEGFKSDMIHTDDGYIVGDYCCYDKLNWDYNDKIGEYHVTIKN